MIRDYRFERATVDQYVKWLRKYMAQGGTPTHHFDYLFERRDCVRYINSEFYMHEEFGANSYQVIMGPTAVCHGGRFGHSGLYLFNGNTKNDPIVPVFDDPIFLTIPQLKNWIAMKRLANHRKLSQLEREFEEDCAKMARKAAECLSVPTYSEVIEDPTGRTIYV